MSDLPKATKRRDLIKRFRDLGWTGPSKGVGDHPAYMEKGTRVQKIPNQHSKGDIGEGLLKAILSQADISQNEWLGRPEEEASDDADDGNGEDPEEDVDERAERRPDGRTDQDRR